MLTAPAPLAPEHQWENFDCGVESLNQWLFRRARPNQMSGASRTYVVADVAMRVAGYYVLAAGAIALAEAPTKLRRNMPDPIPMAILGRLAIDRQWHGQGLGAALLQDAVLRTRQAAAIMGIRGLLVHALSEEAKRFYEYFGFTAIQSQSMTLILSLAEPAASGPGI